MRGETIKLKAAVISNQHTTKSHLVWDSDKDGRLGSGSSLLLNHLSVGLHRITVSGYSLKVSIQITIFQDLWALYQSPLSLASINSINRDFTLNWIDGSASDEKWKLYEPPKFDQKLTDPSKLVLFAKLRVLKHQRFDEPLPFTSGKTIYEHLLKYSKKINLRLDCNFNSAGGGTLSLNRQFSVWDGRASADVSNPHRCKEPYPHRSLYHYTNSLYLLLHENRHNMSDDPSHTTCGGFENMDQRLEGGSGHAWASDVSNVGL